MKFYSLLLVILVGIGHLTLLSQDTNVAPTEITPSTGSPAKVELSPDGSYLAVMTLNPQGDFEIEVWNTTETTDPIKLVPDLTLFDNFFWSPNSQHIAVTGRRGNASGTEFALLVYDILDDNWPNAAYPGYGRDFREFVAYEDTGPYPDYSPVWSSDGNIIAANFRGGVYFYDVSDCKRW